jgi:type IV fimbrial biogenesis protein FimT
MVSKRNFIMLRQSDAATQLGRRVDNRLKTSRTISGFSLIELMVVLAVVAVLAGFATPSMVTWQQSRKLNGAVSNLTADLEVAKMRAIRENSFIAVILTAEGYTIFVDNGAGSGDAGDWIRSGDEALVQRRTFPQGVQIQMADVSLPNSRVRFNGRGFPMDVAATESIPISNERGRKIVTITRLGNVRVN